MINKLKNYKYFWHILLLNIVFVAFFNTLDNDFTNWDDPYYVTNNKLIHQLNFDNIAQIFKQGFTGTYVPLSIVSLAIDYQVGGGKPFMFHLTNLLLHLANTLLVFLIIKKLFISIRIAFGAALLFGIATMQVESVAWVTERKDVLYSFFFLFSIFQYIKFKFLSQRKFLFVSIAAFILSLFSKSQAVTLPLVLLLVEYFLFKNIKFLKILKTLIPYFILSLLFGIIAIKFSQSTYSEGLSYTFSERLLLSAYSLPMYIIKLILPVNLSAIYSYPFLSGNINLLTVLVAFLSIVYIYFLVISIKRKLYVISFGLSFFLVNILLMLQIFPVGIAFMADRFSYIASIGIFLCISFGYDSLIKKYMSKTRFYWAIALIYFHLLGFNTIARNEVWANSINLWNDTLSKNATSSTAYINRGNAFKKLGNYEMALSDYNKGISLNSYIPDAYYSRGLLYMEISNFEAAIVDFKAALTISPKYLQALIQLGNAYYSTGKNDLSLKAHEQVLAVDSNQSAAYSGIANVFFSRGEVDKAMLFFNKALKLNSKDADVYYNRANAYVSVGNLELAIIDYNNAIKFNPNKAIYFSNRGSTKFYMKDINGALNDLNKAIELEKNKSDYYYNRGNIYLYSNQINHAINDYNKSIELNPKASESYYKRGYAFFVNNDKISACRDFKTAYELGYNKANNELTKFCN